jgi:hypothetical protein
VLRAHHACHRRCARHPYPSFRVTYPPHIRRPSLAETRRVSSLSHVSGWASPGGRVATCNPTGYAILAEACNIVCCAVGSFFPLYTAMQHAHHAAPVTSVRPTCHRAFVRFRVAASLAPFAFIVFCRARHATDPPCFTRCSPPPRRRSNVRCPRAPAQDAARRCRGTGRCLPSSPTRRSSTARRSSTHRQLRALAHASAARLD